MRSLGRQGTRVPRTVTRVSLSAGRGGRSPSCFLGRPLIKKLCRTEHMRCAASGPGWHERFLNPEEPSGASSAAHALAQGHSIIELAHVATAAECEALRAAASATAATERRKRESSRLWSFDGSNGIDRIRLPVLEHFCERMNGADVDGSTLCDALLVRACDTGCGAHRRKRSFPHRLLKQNDVSTQQATRLLYGRACDQRVYERRPFQASQRPSIADDFDPAVRAGGV